MKHTKNTTGGFTAVEMLITLFVTVIFLNAFYLLFNTITSSNSIAQQAVEASDFAYSDMQYGLGTGGKVPCVSVLSTDTGNPNYPDRNDLTADPNAPGTAVTTDPSNPYQNGPEPPPPYTFAGPVSSDARIFYPYGCGAGLPAEGVITVTYGPFNRKVSHANYTP